MEVISAGNSTGSRAAVTKTVTARRGPQLKELMGTRGPDVSQHLSPVRQHELHLYRSSS